MQIIINVNIKNKHTMIYYIIYIRSTKKLVEFTV